MARQKICPICYKRLNSLGYARHMAMHRDEGEPGNKIIPQYQDDLVNQ